MKVSTLIRADKQESTPWKNGQGSTVQLAIYPEGASLNEGNFIWRVSMATISASGSFSKFAGFDRGLVQVSGGRLELGHGESSRLRLLAPMKVHYFQGERALQCRVTSPPAVDINAMVDRSWGSLKMSALTLKVGQTENLSLTADHCHLFCVEGDLKLKYEDTHFALTQNELQAFENESPQTATAQNLEISGGEAEVKIVIVELSKR